MKRLQTNGVKEEDMRKRRRAARALSAPLSTPTQRQQSKKQKRPTQHSNQFPSNSVSLSIQPTRPAENRLFMYNRESTLKDFIDEVIGWQFVSGGLQPYDSSQNISEILNVPIPDCFRSASQYIGCFRPFLISEVRAELEASLHKSSTREFKLNNLSESTSLNKHGRGGDKHCHVNDDGYWYAELSSNNIVHDRSLCVGTIVLLSHSRSCISDCKTSLNTRKGRKMNSTDINVNNTDQVDDPRLRRRLQRQQNVKSHNNRIKSVTRFSTPKKKKEIADHVLGVVLKRRIGQVEHLLVKLGSMGNQKLALSSPRKNRSANVYICPLSQLITAKRQMSALLLISEFRLVDVLLSGHPLHIPDASSLDALNTYDNINNDKTKEYQFPTTQSVMNTIDSILELSIQRARRSLGNAFCEYILKNFNTSQAVAICAAAVGTENEYNLKDVSMKANGETDDSKLVKKVPSKSQFTPRGFSLVQGPPGTGKTTMLVGLLNTLHLQHYNLYYDKLISKAGHAATRLVDLQRNVRKVSTSCKPKPFLPNDTPNPAATSNSVLADAMNQLDAHMKEIRQCAQVTRPRILVVAPSNAAVDEIIRRIIKNRFRAGDGSLYNPHLVRLGNRYDKDIMNVTLNCLAQKELRRSKREIGERSKQFKKESKHADIRISKVEKQLYTLMIELLNETSRYNNFVSSTWNGPSRYVSNRNMKDVNVKPEKRIKEVYVKQEKSDRQVYVKQEKGIQKKPDRQVYIKKEKGIQKQRSVESIIRSAASASHSCALDAFAASNVAIAAVKFSKWKIGWNHRQHAVCQKLIRVYTERTSISSKLSILLHVEQGVKSRVEQALLEAADIIFTTLSSSGMNNLEKASIGTEFDLAGGAVGTGRYNAPMGGFRYPISSQDSALGKRQFSSVVIDEAAQCVELECLIPLRFEAPHCVLIGDPRQLPATVLSQQAKKQGYGRSLFERLAQRGHPVRMLNTQYRCHPKISAFPSLYFYNGKLLDGENVTSNEYDMNFHHHISGHFRPFIFFNLAKSLESRGLGDDFSWHNIVEAKHAFAIYSALIREFPNGPVPWKSIAGSTTFKRGWENRIGIITPYRAQIKELKKHFGDTNNVEINTVDAFQGREKDIIIISCVRAQSDKQRDVGFLHDIRRLNVALTRAKYGLWIVGHAPTLRTSSAWNALIEHAVAKNVYINVS